FLRPQPRWCGHAPRHKLGQHAGDTQGGKMRLGRSTTGACRRYCLSVWNSRRSRSRRRCLRGEGLRGPHPRHCPARRHTLALTACSRSRRSVRLLQLLLSGSS
ncbi:unnamed protein product, partial [Ectocarpus sp. 12 AP-2014]